MVSVAVGLKLLLWAERASERTNLRRGGHARRTEAAMDGTRVPSIVVVRVSLSSLAATGSELNLCAHLALAAAASPQPLPPPPLALLALLRSCRSVAGEQISWRDLESQPVGGKSDSGGLRPDLGSHSARHIKKTHVASSGGRLAGWLGSARFGWMDG